MNDRTKIDWEKIETDFRAGIKSVREIASEHGITHTAVNKRAKRDGWDRDLQGRIRAKAEALVALQVAKSVSVERMATDRVVVDTNANKVAEVHLGQRAMIARMNAHVNSLMTKLDAIDADGDDIPRAVDTAKKLSETMKIVIGMERETYGIGVGADETRAPAGLNHFYGD